MICKYTKQECKYDEWSDICNTCPYITKDEIKIPVMVKSYMESAFRTKPIE